MAKAAISAPVAKPRFWSASAVLLLSLAVVATALAVVYAKYQSRSLFSELQSLRQAQDQMDVEWSQLLLEQSTWATHGRVEDAARNRLEMQLPEPDQVVIIKQ